MLGSAFYISVFEGWLLGGVVAAIFVAHQFGFLPRPEASRSLVAVPLTAFAFVLAKGLAS